MMRGSWRGEKECRVWQGKPDESKPLARDTETLRETCLEETGHNVVDWIGLPEDRNK
jgi:hypothetical protein